MTGINSLATVDYGYTRKGNRYEKSSDGVKAGKIAGQTLGMAGVIGGATYLEMSGKHISNFVNGNANGITNTAREFGKWASTGINNFVAKHPKVGEWAGKAGKALAPVKNKISGWLANPKVQNVLKSKGAKVAALAAAAIAIVKVCEWCGKVSGKKQDAIVDMTSRYKADRMA
jgi:hypothetical protein